MLRWMLASRFKCIAVLKHVPEPNRDLLRSQTLKAASSGAVSPSLEWARRGYLLGHHRWGKEPVAGCVTR